MCVQKHSTQKLFAQTALASCLTKNIFVDLQNEIVCGLVFCKTFVIDLCFEEKRQKMRFLLSTNAQKN